MNQKKSRVSHLAKLNANEVRKIRRWAAAGISQMEMIRRLKKKVSQSAICWLLQGRTYRHVR